MTALSINTFFIMTLSKMGLILTCYNDTQYNDIQHKETQYKDIQHNDTGYDCRHEMSLF
jgi:hypothetical protein